MPNRLVQEVSNREQAPVLQLGNGNLQIWKVAYKANAVCLFYFRTVEPLNLERLNCEPLNLRPQDKMSFTTCP